MKFFVCFLVTVYALCAEGEFEGLFWKPTPGEGVDVSQCVPRAQCTEDTLWTGPLCARVDGVVRNFVDNCNFNYAECLTGKQYERLERTQCNFPADYGVDPKWFQG